VHSILLLAPIIVGSFIFIYFSQPTHTTLSNRTPASRQSETAFAMTGNAPLHDQCVLIRVLAQDAFFSQLDVIPTQAGHCHSDEHVSTRHLI